jgi:hypothetical protein
MRRTVIVPLTMVLLASAAAAAAKDTLAPAGGRRHDLVHSGSIVARGKLLSGDLVHDRLVVTELATGSTADWPGPFGDPQLNQMAALGGPGVKTAPMREINRGSDCPLP